MPVLVHRLTGRPPAFLAMKFLSRSSFINLAIRSSAKSQETSLKSPLPGARYFGDLSRVGAWTISSSAEPLGHNVPRFTGWSGSPSMWMMLDRAFFARSLMVQRRIPQATEQWVLVLRVWALPSAGAVGGKRQE